MSAFYQPGQPGLNVVVLQSDDEKDLILIEYNTKEGAEDLETPIFWGSDEFGTLTEAENEALSAILPAVAKAKCKPAPDPEPVPEPKKRNGALDAAFAILVLVGLAYVFLPKLLQM